MPSGKIHAAIGLSLWYGLQPHLSLLPVVVGSLLPDCDHRAAPAGKILPLWAIPGVKHRGITHTLYALGVLSGCVALWLGPATAVSFAVGYMSHLLADACTPAGVRWFGVKKKPRRVRRGSRIRPG